MTFKAALWIGVALVGPFAAATLAVAASPVPQRPVALQAVIDCRKIEDGAQRLACYDSTVGAMTKAEETGDLVTLDREQRKAVRKQAFGFSLPSLSLFDTGEKPEAMDQIQETVSSASQGAQGRWVFVMQDGAVWRQTDDEFLSRSPHPGSAVVIKRAMLGSYMLIVDGQPGVRAHREQ